MVERNEEKSSRDVRVAESTGKKRMGNYPFARSKKIKQILLNEGGGKRVD